MQLFHRRITLNSGVYVYMSIWNENWIRTEKSLEEDFYYISISLINEMSMIEVLKRR